MTSEIAIAGVGGAVVEAIRVTIDIEHTWDRDLSITLRSPEGTDVLLIGRAGGSANDFRNTTLDDDAPVSITEGTNRREGQVLSFVPFVLSVDNVVKRGQSH